MVFSLHGIRPRAAARVSYALLFEIGLARTIGWTRSPGLSAKLALSSPPQAAHSRV